MASPAVAVSRRKHIWFLLIVVLVTAVAVGGWWFQSDRQPNQNLLTVPVQRGDLEDLVTVEACGDTWLRYRTADPERVNPRLLQQLAGRGAPVVTLSEVPRSLEEVYLRIVNE
jgi:hypothetical protein